MNESQVLNQKMYEFARHWGDGADLEVSGVSLADCVEYDVLSVIGRQLLAGADSQAEAQA